MIAPGASLQSRYRILRQIGGGGMAEVYLAEDTRLPGRRCAIKEMSPAQLAPQNRQWAILAFQQEAQILARLAHTGLTAVTDFFAEGGNWYLVMEYVDGETLEDRLERTPGKCLALPDALHIVYQLCDVLEYLHQQNPPVIFRDLKPGNVMLTLQGDVKLIDFGVARFFKPGQTRDTVNLGTPGFAAPEQYGGKGQTDPRTDVYSLGVLLHHVLTGYDPAATPFNLPPAQTINSAVPAEIEAIIQRAIQIAPDLRFQSMAELRQALSDVMRVPTMPLAPLVPATPVAQPYRTPTVLMPPQPVAHPNQGMWIGLGAAAIILVSIAMFGWLKDRQPSPAPTNTPRPVTVTRTVTSAPKSSLVPTSTKLPTQTQQPTWTPTSRPTVTPVFLAYVDDFDKLDDNMWTISTANGVRLNASNSALMAVRGSIYSSAWGEETAIRLRRPVDLSGVKATLEWKTMIHTDAMWMLVYQGIRNTAADRYLVFDCGPRDLLDKSGCVVNLRRISDSKYVWGPVSLGSVAKGVWHTFTMVNPAPRYVEFYVDGVKVSYKAFSPSEWNGMDSAEAEWLVMGWPQDNDNKRGYNTIHAALDYFSYQVP
jgi:serine/threonine-protein kinase